MDVPVIEHALASERPPAAFPDDDTFETDPECGTMKYFGEGMAGAMEGWQDGVFAVYGVLLPDLGAHASEPAQHRPRLRVRAVDDVFRAAGL